MVMHIWGHSAYSVPVVECIQSEIFGNHDCTNKKMSWAVEPRGIIKSRVLTCL